MASATANGRAATRPRAVPLDRAVADYRLAPGLAVRIGILGIVALVVFGVLFLRLWALQVLSGTQYLRAAQNNQLRTMPMQAARGPIVDRNGVPLVTNVAGTSIRVWPSDLPKDGRYTELRRLARLVNVPFAQIAADLRKHARDPLAPVTVEDSARDDVVFYLSEHRDEFPGVEIARSYLRHYPYGSLGAQVVGAVGEVTQQQLDSSAGRAFRPGDEIGQSGIERAYDAYLRGQSGVAHLRVDSLGRPLSALQISQEPTPGYQLRLTLDVKLQQAAERALSFGIGAARNDGAWAANGGAIVALDPRDGSILALASSPTYSPSLYVGRKPARLLRPLLDQTAAAKANFPGLDRAIEGSYPPGSTFKPVTALAALEEHLISPYDTLPCQGQITIKGQTFKNWDPYVYEGMTMPVALAASCDTYFYQLGYKFWQLPPERGQPLQEWASRFGFGRTTGVDLPGEQAGLLPTIAWRHARYTAQNDPLHWQVDRLWKPGDSIQLAIGQKDLQVTPLQMARFYALIANGGRLVTPHIAEDVEQAGDGRTPAVVRRRFAPPAPQRVDVDSSALEVVRSGLDEATHGTIGTSEPIFGSFPYRIAGKTGTAEKTVFLPGQKTGLNLSQSWWCGYGPTDNPTIVVCALIENGGHGGTAAAPAALHVFEQYFGRQATQHGTVYSD
ncbi:MAG TPA: penicillin-binding protein 2 [Gaiellaceae bacterium]